MKKIALAVAASVVLGGCGTVSTNTGSGGGMAAAGTSAPAGTQYCWSDRLATEGGRHNCNFASDKRTACEGTAFTTIEAARYGEPKKGTRCSNGQWLVELSPR